MEIRFNDWDDSEDVTIPQKQSLFNSKLEDRIKRITTNYDRGRCTVYFDNVEVFCSMNVGTDFQLSFTFDEAENKDG